MGAHQHRFAPHGPWVAGIAVIGIKGINEYLLSFLFFLFEVYVFAQKHGLYKISIKNSIFGGVKNDYSLDNGKSYLIMIMNRYSFVVPP